MSLRVAWGKVPYKEARERATQALPTGERLVQAEVAFPGRKLPTPWRWNRPRVLVGHRLPGDRWEGTKRAFWWIFWRLDAILVTGPELFGGRRPKGKALKGGWGSLGGGLATALWPRVPTTDALPVLQLTDRHLHVSYVQRGRRRGELGAVEPGWSVAAGEVAWVRHRTDIDADTFEFGFTDGSWARVQLRSQHAVYFTKCFPQAAPGRPW
ncbi:MULTISPECIES: hypothetical protein [unclassified Streptomyces]|uniref:hypothetical protein n=1 Tax=unclassified Streptomyces TaxID=2593676 RepID=UPI00089D669C|nr:MULTISPECIES: hypothetical protein [unclassified Streptomyces]PBC86420.1 hypothetical protein BX261_6501 [Streptomyces sp. 2321.6]SED66524.1 hypothetical protein SAMN05428954_0724 [Streptomyces sp. 2112.3]SED91746.1 hypothetical protein SAMN05428945_6037 [Streptomyces sp. 2224.1]SED97880.1 hypothetical protein SAMN05428940_6527 [Streptomyces sp. 2133.1]SNC73331.1 hypothetical protein SAMN06272741_6430 [Streptomyces sp. 2114.4]